MKQLVLCSCGESQQIDRDGLEKATGLVCSKVHSELCGKQIEQAAKALTSGDSIICCTQEAQRFTELAEDLGMPEPALLDLRDRAGWTDDSASTLPKMAALAAEAVLPRAAEKTLDVVSEGLCLIVGAGDVALPVAEDLCDALAVTVLLTDDSDAPLHRRFDVVRGRLARATGALGGFELTIDALQQMNPAGRGALGFGAPQDGGRSVCDIILDLRGGTALFPAPEKREGYLRADPKSPTAVAKASLQALQLVGTFEKPLYIHAEPHLCAHSRASKTGCSNCLDICPTGAIVPNGDHVTIDPMICAGCGACAALCPSGAVSYDAPPVSELFARMETLARTYRTAGGTAPRLLVHDDSHGQQMIALLARFGRGLPADVIPLEVSALGGFGHAEMLAALGVGFATVDLLLSPRTETEALERERDLAEAIAGAGKLRLLSPADPDALEAGLFGQSTPAPVAAPILPMGTRRQVSRLAARALNPVAEVLPLPESAPYGQLVINTDACTLCLSCVSLCPSGALNDNPDLPQLRFQEDACLQCGLCANICPEKAITLDPRLNLTQEALEQRVLNEEEPFACIECGSLFGVKSTVERITEKLANSHSMFGNPEAIRMIQMCDDCRVQAQFHSQNNPFQGKERPRVRTTEDYFSKRRDH